MIILILFIIIIALAIAYVATNIRIVPQANAWVIERLGKYSQTWDAGLHVKVPFIDCVVGRVSLKERVLDFPPQPVITKDNVTMQIDSVVFCKVSQPKLYVYGVERPIESLQNLAATTLRQIVGSLELDQTLTGRDYINNTMRQILDEVTDPWGIKVTRVEIKNIKPPEEIEAVMSKQMKAEREKRQASLEAQAHKEAVVLIAEGDKTAMILNAEAEKEAQIRLAEGKAAAIEKVYEAELNGITKLREAGINDEILRLIKGAEAIKDVADGKATKIFIPSDIAGVVSAFGVAGEAMRISDPGEKCEAETGIKVKNTYNADNADYNYDIGEIDAACITRKEEINKGTIQAHRTNRKISETLREKTNDPV